MPALAVQYGADWPADCRQPGRRAGGLSTARLLQLVWRVSAQKCLPWPPRAAAGPQPTLDEPERQRPGVFVYRKRHARTHRPTVVGLGARVGRAAIKPPASRRLTVIRTGSSPGQMPGMKAQMRLNQTGDEVITVVIVRVQGCNPAPSHAPWPRRSTSGCSCSGKSCRRRLGPPVRADDAPPWPSVGWRRAPARPRAPAQVGGKRLLARVSAGLTMGAKADADT